MMKWICSNTRIGDKSLNSHNDYLLSLVTISQIQIKGSCSLPLFFLSWKSSNDFWERAPNFQKKPLQAEQTEEKIKNKKTEKHNCQKQTRKDKFLYSEVTTRKVCRCILIPLLPRWQVCQGPESPRSIITHQPISPQQRRCCSNRSVALSDPCDSRRETQGNRIFNKAHLLRL